MASEITAEQIAEIEELVARAQAAAKIIETYDPALTIFVRPSAPPSIP